MEGKWDPQMGGGDYEDLGEYNQYLYDFSI